MNKYFNTTKSVVKLVVSTTSNSIVFNGSQQMPYIMPRWEENAVFC